MNLQQHLLGKIAEECTELAQMALKSQQFGYPGEVSPCYGATNQELLTKEYADLIGIIRLAAEFGVEVDESILGEAVRRKRVKAAFFALETQKLGSLKLTHRQQAALEEILDQEPEITRSIYLKHQDDLDKVRHETLQSDSGQ